MGNLCSKNKDAITIPELDWNDGISIWQEIGKGTHINDSAQQWKIEKISHQNIYRAVSHSGTYYSIHEQKILKDGDIINILPKDLKVQLVFTYNDRKRKKIYHSYIRKTLSTNSFTSRNYRFSSKVIDPFMVNYQWTIMFWIKERSSNLQLGTRIFSKSGTQYKNKSPILEVSQIGVNKLFITLRFIELVYSGQSTDDTNFVHIKTVINNIKSWNHVIWTQNKDIGTFYINGVPDIVPFALYNSLFIINNGDLTFNGKDFDFKNIRIFSRYFSNSEIEILYNHENKTINN